MQNNVLTHAERNFCKLYKEVGEGCRIASDWHKPITRQLASLLREEMNVIGRYSTDKRVLWILRKC